MAANLIEIQIATALDTANEDNFTTRFGSGQQTFGQGSGYTGQGSTSWVPNGVGWGGAAIIAREFARFLLDFATGGPNVTQTATNPVPVSITVTDGITPAVGSFTFTGVGTVGDTVTINSSVLTAVANGTTPTVAQWQLGTTAAQSALNLIQAINRVGVAAAISGTVSAWLIPSTPTIVYVACEFGGIIGNLVPIAKTSTSITISGAFLTGGTSNEPLTVQH